MFRCVSIHANTNVCGCVYVCVICIKIFAALYFKILIFFLLTPMNPSYSIGRALISKAWFEFIITIHIHCRERKTQNCGEKEEQNPFENTLRTTTEKGKSATTYLCNNKSEMGNWAFQVFAFNRWLVGSFIPSVFFLSRFFARSLIRLHVDSFSSAGYYMSIGKWCYYFLCAACSDFRCSGYPIGSWNLSLVPQIRESIYYCYCCRWRCRCCCYFYYSCSFSLVDIHIDASLNTSHSEHGTVSNTSASIENIQMCCVVILLICLLFKNMISKDRWKKIVPIMESIFVLFDMRHKLDVINHNTSKKLHTINCLFKKVRLIDWNFNNGKFIWNGIKDPWAWAWNTW